MTKLPQSTVQTMQFGNGVALGSSQKWVGGQFCSILTVRGFVGCGIYDVKTAERFGQAVAIARGTPQRPLCEPEDLLEARIVELTPQAAALGVVAGMTGREAVERMLGAGEL
jgi:uncharacterized protein YunC (DUF1805 family)